MTHPTLTEPFRLDRVFGDVPESARELARGLDPAPSAAYVAEHAVRIAFPERMGDGLFRDVVYRSTLDNVDLMWRAIAGTASLDGATPAGALAFAEAAAELGVPVHQFERVYRVGIGLVWICWSREATAFAERTGADLNELIQAPTLIIHAYIDTLLGPMLARYDATGAAALRTSEHLRRSILRQALDGTPILEDPDAVEALAADPCAEYVAFVARGDGIDVDDLALYARESCGASRSLVFRDGLSSWVIWLAHDDSFGVAGMQLLHDALERTGTRIAVSDPSRDGDAIGLCGRDALETARIQELIRHDGTLLRHSEVRLESLLFSEPDRARRFVRTELRGLDEDSDRVAVLRDTAMTWLSTGSNVATAARLGLHEHTVRNRVAQADELVGQPLAVRRTEILVALRLRRILDDGSDG